jgi:hypothetical protein
MRSAIGIFGLVCGAVVIWTVASYGYSTADDPATRWNIAFLYAVIATAGLFGHAVAVRVWRVSGFWSIAIGLTCATALLINLSNRLGALVGRDAKVDAEATAKAGKIADDKAELKRLQRRLDGLGQFTPTDEAAIVAAKTAASTATNRRIAECGPNNEKRGSQCKARENDEAVALQALTSTTSFKTTTDKAAEIEAAMRPIRERLLAAGTVEPTNVRGKAIARLFRLPDSEAEFASTAQNFILAAVVEAIIVLCMITYELLAPGRQQVQRASAMAKLWQAVRSKPAEPDIMLPEPPRAAARAPEPLPQPGAILAAPRLAPIADSRPRLVASNPINPAIGAIPKILTAALDPADGERVEIADAYRCYAQECAKESKRPVTPEQFAEPLARFCKGAEIRTKRMRDGSVYLLDVRLVHVEEKFQADAV